MAENLIIKIAGIDGAGQNWRRFQILRYIFRKND
jgi:hypothetical protein